MSTEKKSVDFAGTPSMIGGMLGRVGAQAGTGALIAGLISKIRGGNFTDALPGGAMAGFTGGGIGGSLIHPSKQIVGDLLGGGAGGALAGALTPVRKKQQAEENPYQMAGTPATSSGTYGKAASRNPANKEKPMTLLEKLALHLKESNTVPMAGSWLPDSKLNIAGTPSAGKAKPKPKPKPKAEPKAEPKAAPKAAPAAAPKAEAPKAAPSAAPKVEAPAAAAPAAAPKFEAPAAAASVAAPKAKAPAADAAAPAAAGAAPEAGGMDLRGLLSKYGPHAGAAGLGAAGGALGGGGGLGAGIGAGTGLAGGMAGAAGLPALLKLLGAQNAAASPWAAHGGRALGSLGAGLGTGALVNRMSGEDEGLKAAEYNDSMETLFNQVYLPAFLVKAAEMNIHITAPDELDAVMDTTARVKQAMSNEKQSGFQLVAEAARNLAELPQEAEKVAEVQSPIGQQLAADPNLLSALLASQR